MACERTPGRHPALDGLGELQHGSVLRLSEPDAGRQLTQLKSLQQLAYAAAASSSGFS